MNKWKVSLLIILTLIISGSPVYGNSGPVTWFQYPGFSIITIDESTPIAVIEEDLHFDFSENEQSDYSLVGAVSAQYRMKNTSETRINGKMVFPFIKNMWGIEEYPVQVLVDGTPIEYQIHYGDLVGSIDSNGDFQESIELQEILESISEEKYEPENFAYDEVGTLYRIHLETDREDSLHVEASFSMEIGDSRLLTKGMNSYAYTQETNAFSVGTWVDKEKRTMEIYSFDEAFEITVKGFESGASDAAEITDFRVDIEVVEMDIEAYLMDFVDADRNLYGETVYFKALDQALEKTSFVNEEDLTSALIAPRYVLIAYEVPFDSMEEKTVEVRYATLGSMDRRETVNPTYTYTYFLHPAKYWKDFRDLTIRITPSEAYPYVLESNLPLTKGNDGIYVGTFETLPEEDFKFTLYEKETITTSDKIKNSLDKNMYFLLIAGFLLFCVLVLVVFGLIVRKLLMWYSNRIRK